MTPSISEFSYGYAVTNEVVKFLGTSIAAAPQFPTLYAEGQAGGGYDVKVVGGSPVFLQFKLSHHMLRSNCKEYGLMGGPYYRWHLHSLQRSDQHNLLLDLESKGNLVLYTAPMFHEATELNSHFLHDGILDNSAAFVPSDIGPLPDEKDHYVVFNRAGVVHRCSENPVPAKCHVLSRFLQDQVNKLEPRSLEAGGLIKLGDQIVESVKVARSRRSQDSVSRPSEIDTEELSRVIRARPSLETLSLISRTVLDSELLVINPQWQRTPKHSP